MGWWYVVAAAWLLMGKPGPANAQAAESTTDELRSEDQRFEHEAAQFDQEALTPDGERMVRQRFAYQFNVDEAGLQSLKDRSLGYGEDLPHAVARPADAGRDHGGERGPHSHAAAGTVLGMGRHLQAPDGRPQDRRHDGAS